MALIQKWVKLGYARRRSRSSWAEWNAFMFNACKNFRCLFAVSTMAALLLVSVADAQQYRAMPRGPLARLVKTPEDSTGVPPYALADQTGTIQRYVEPVPGVDLESHVNQIVSVRHDTGETLLASQLDLPVQPLYPMVSEGYAQMAAIPPRAGYAVQQAAYVDNDDSTVELIEEGDTLPPGTVTVPEGVMPQGAIYPDGTPAYAPMQPGMPMGAGSVYYDPAMGGYPADYGMGQEFVGYPGDPSQNMGFVQPFGQPAAQASTDRPHIFGEVEINFLRAHVPESTFGKLSEKYEFSPRFIIGFTDIGNFSGRVRYWVYGRGTSNLEDGGGVHIDFDVFDVEATHRFVGKKTELELAAGMRLAKIEINDSQADACGTDLIGITAAADGWTPLFNCSQGCFGWVYGGRISILAGDWGGDADSDLINTRIQDDNVLVNELYAGLGFTRCCRNLTLNSRIGFEMQNWHSDVLSSEGFADSIGFVGPGVEIGAQF